MERSKRSRRREEDEADEYDQSAQNQAKRKRNESPPDSEDGSSDEEQESLECSQHPDFNLPKNEAEVGIIEKITLENFMCHTMLEVPFGPNVNFVIGRNGSGKSAILTGLVVGLGGKATTTNRGSSLKGFIKKKCSSAQVSVKLRNRGQDAYQFHLYGPSIIIERRISSDGSASYKIKSHEGKVISHKKDELNHILDQFNIQVDNPVSVLNQDTSRNFLNSSDPKDKYKFFLKATQLEQMSYDYQHIIEQQQVIKDTLSRKSETLPEMLRHVKRLEEKYKDIAQLKNMKEQVDELKKLRVWAEVVELERKVPPMEKAVQEQKDKLPRYDEKIGVFQTEITALENEWRAAGQQENEIKEEAQALQNQQQALFSELKQKKSVLRDKQSKIRKLRQDERSAIRDKKQLEERIQEIRSTAMRDLESERRQREETLQQKREELKAWESQLSTTTHHRGQIEQAINRARERLYQLKSERQDARRNLDQAQRDLQNLQGSRSNRFSLFGPWVPELLQRVETAVRRGRFHQSPVGPIGAHIRLKDDQWALAVETCLKGLGWSFCCHDSHDQQILQQMMKQLNVRNMPNIIVSRFQDHVYDVSKNRPDCDYPTILDMLVVDNPVVANCLIDQASVEMVLLIEDPRTAREVIFSRPPSNMTRPRAFTPTGEHLIGGATAKSYATHQKAAAYLQKDIEGEIRRLQHDVNEKKAHQQQLDQEYRELETSHQQDQRELQRAKSKAYKEQQEVNKIMGEINEIENVEEEQLPDVTTLEEEVGSYTQRLQEIEQESQVVKEEFEQAQDAVVKQEIRSNQHKEKIQELLEKADPFRNEMQKIERDIAEKKSHLKHYQDRRKIIEDNIRTAEKDLNSMIRKVEHTSHLASQYCERIDPGRRTVKSMESEISQMEKRIRTEERERGNHEEITREYYEAKKKYEEIDKSMTNLKKYQKRLKEVMSIRAQSFVDYRKYIAVRAKYFFQMMLAQRGYSGRMKFDHDSESLRIQVNVDQGTKRMTKDTRSLSGGERSFSTVSFIMALWEAMESPFRCLDEFDIFMDMVNRRISMDMMMKVAKEQPERQFILLTPLNMSGIEGGRSLRIFRLQDPERGQTTLTFEAEQQD